MSRVDENGVRHPTEEDPWDVQTQAHIAYCLECNPYADVRLAALLAEAWDRGFSTCAGEFKKQREDPTYPITRVNPYKPRLGPKDPNQAM